MEDRSLTKLLADEGMLMAIKGLGVLHFLGRARKLLELLLVKTTNS